MAKRILVVEDEPHVVAPIRAALMQQGYDVVTAGDGQEGLAKAQAAPPDLAILDVMMPRMDGWTLLQNLRAMPEFAMLPVIFLTALPVQEQMVGTLKLGGVDYLPKPFRFEELLRRVAAGLHRAAQAEAAIRARAGLTESGRQAAISSSLAHLSLPTLLGLVDQEKKTGIITLTRSGTQQAGHIFVREGRVVRARLVGDSSVVNAAAVYHLMSWQDGTAEFHPGNVEGADEVQSSTTHLLIEGARILDEALKL